MISIEGLLEDEQGLSMGELLTVKFRQPSHEKQMNNVKSMRTLMLPELSKDN
jgi:hypothetical protein